MRGFPGLADGSRPFTGAWIETSCRSRISGRCGRSPLHGGVDRNNPNICAARTRRMSPLHGGVDRNCQSSIACRPDTGVAPSRGRGSKHSVPDAIRLPADAGRPFTGAWIETCREHDGIGERARCRPFTGAWIETRLCQRHIGASIGRPFTGAWIETIPNADEAERGAGRPFTGAWIETAQAAQVSADGHVAPSRGRGSKRHHAAGMPGHCRSPLHGGVDRNL